MVEIIPLARVAPAAVEVLLDAAFGADRHGRTAYRLRCGMAAIPALCFAAVDGARLVGSIQCWPVAHQAAKAGAVTPLVLVGPVAVDPAMQRGGLGRHLMRAMLAAAPAHADGALMMIGDPEYYDRFFQFSSQHTARWTLPGPVEARRLLARPIGAHRVPDAPGSVGPRAPLAPAGASPT